VARHLVWWRSSPVAPWPREPAEWSKLVERVRAVYGIVLLASLLVLLSAVAVRGFEGAIEACRTIYIRADGSISPSTAKITCVDNVTYVFTDSNQDSIVVQRDNIVIDGAGYTLRGKHLWNSRGIDLAGRRNVRIKNVEIKEFFFGVWLKTSSHNSIYANKITINKVGIRLSNSSSNSISTNNITANMDYNIYLEYSSNNSILGNNIAAKKVWVSTLYYSFFGICLRHSSSNIICGNNMTNSEYGLQLSSSSNNNISRNNIANNTYGILLWKSSANAIYGNNASDNDYGIVLTHSSDNTVCHDNFMDNTKQVYSHNSRNVWDDGYPSGGNYWSDYKDKHPDAEELNESGIWDMSYVVDENNQDNYPLANPWVPKQAAPPPPQEGVPLWMQRQLWAIAAAILILAGAVYILKKIVTGKQPTRRDRGSRSSDSSLRTRLSKQYGKDGLRS